MHLITLIIDSWLYSSAIIFGRIASGVPWFLHLTTVLMQLPYHCRRSDLAFMTLQSRSEPSSDLAIMLSLSQGDIICATMNTVCGAWNIKGWFICVTTVSELKIELQAQMNTRRSVFYTVSNLVHLKIWNMLCPSWNLERLLDTMEITYLPY